MTNTQAISLFDVTFRYDGREVIRNISLDIPRNDFLFVIGPNGAGKTTLLRLMTGFLKPDNGTVSMFGTDIREMKVSGIARLSSLVSQQESASFPYTVREIVLLGRHPHHRSLGFDLPEDVEYVDYILELTGLTPFAQRSIMELSGGEFHRVTIARALAQDTPLLLLDEPGAHLDVRHQIHIFDLLTHLNTHRSRTIVCVTHDLNIAAMYARRIMLLSDGHCVTIAAPEDVLAEELLSRYYHTRIERHHTAGGVALLPRRGDISFERFPPFPRS